MRFHQNNTRHKRKKEKEMKKSLIQKKEELREQQVWQVWVGRRPQ